MMETILIPAKTILEPLYGRSDGPVLLTQPLRAGWDETRPKKSCPIWLDNSSYHLPKNFQKLPRLTIPRGLKSKLTKGSIWEFEKDWTYVPYQTRRYPVVTIPMGTKFHVTTGRIQYEYWALLLQYPFGTVRTTFLTEDQSGAPKKVLSWQSGPWKDLPWQDKLPIAEILPFVRLVQEGERRGRWWLVRDDDSRIAEKPFDTLAAVKASARVRFFGATTTHWEHQGPSPDISQGVWALHLDDGKVVEKIDLSSYLIMKKLGA